MKTTYRLKGTRRQANAEAESKWEQTEEGQELKKLESDNG